MRQGQGSGARFRIQANGADDGPWARVATAEALAGLARGQGSNLVRFDLDDLGVAFLDYPACQPDQGACIGQLDPEHQGIGLVAAQHYVAN